MDKILLIDGHNFLWKANIKFGSDKNSHVKIKENTNCICGGNWDYSSNSCDFDFIMIFNFFRNLRAIIGLFSPDKCFFVLEGRPQFRHDLYSAYKANRIIKTGSISSPTNAQQYFFKNKDLSLSLLTNLPITLCKSDNFECDDVISSLCENLKEEDLTVVSNDSDFIQLLQKGYNKIQIYNPFKKTYMEAPDYPYVAWKSLNGDKSDNIPGLLTPKKALNMIQSPTLFQSFLDIEENRSLFSINKKLIEFYPVPEEEIIFVEGSRNFNNLKENFSYMKFESIINDKSWNKFTSTFDCLKF